MSRFAVQLWLILNPLYHFKNNDYVTYPPPPETVCKGLCYIVPMTSFMITRGCVSLANLVVDSFDIGVLYCTIVLPFYDRFRPLSRERGKRDVYK